MKEGWKKKRSLLACVFSVCALQNTTLEASGFLVRDSDECRNQQNTTEDPCDRKATLADVKALEQPGFR